MDGTISSAGFADDHRFVIGNWRASPIGPFADVMWATPDGERILMVPNPTVADFVTSIYVFDEVRVGPLFVESSARRTTVAGHGIDVDLIGGRRRGVPVSRPLAMTRFVEAPIARTLMGVRTFGTSPTGVREWYQARSWCWVKRGDAVLHGRDLGAPRRMMAPTGFGFSEPPRRPSIVSLRVAVDVSP